jgi:thioredoxin
MPLMEMTDVGFDKFLKAGKKPILLDFWAEWCGPCRMIRPALEELSESFASEIDFFALDVDKNPETAKKYGIMSIPTLMVFKNGDLFARQVGAAPKTKIAEWLQNAGVLEKERGELGGEEIGIAWIEDKLKIVSLTRDGRYRFLDSNSVYHNICRSVGVVDPRRQRIVEEFEALLNYPRSTEHMFQDFFAAHPDFIINDDYRGVHSQIVLERSGSRKLIPDFVLEPYNSNSLCDILELKRPDAGLFVDKKNRPRFSAAVFEAVAQLREYQEYFELEEHRKLVERYYGLKLFRPRLILVIGRRGTLSPLQFKKAQGDFPTVTIQTYDDLLEKFKRKFKV